MENRKRLSYIDTSAGLMILFMLYYHLVYFSRFSPIPAYLIGFYMPFFFYKSGMFFKSRPQRGLIQKDSPKLLRTFLIYSLIGWIVWSVCMLCSGYSVINCLRAPLESFIHIGNIKGNDPLWFLLCIFFVREIFNFLVNKNVNALVIAIVSYLIGFIFSSIGFQDYTWWFGNWFTGLCFFSLGYVITRFNNKIAFLLAIIIVLLFGVGEVLDIIQVPRLYTHANKMTRGNYLLYLPWALACVVFTINFFRYAQRFLKFRILDFVGTNALHIYIWHWILFTVATFFTKEVLGIESVRIHWIILVVSALVFLPMICYISKLVKKKDPEKKHCMRC